MDLLSAVTEAYARPDTVVCATNRSGAQRYYHPACALRSKHCRGLDLTTGFGTPDFDVVPSPIQWQNGWGVACHYCEVSLMALAQLVQEV